MLDRTTTLPKYEAFVGCLKENRCTWLSADNAQHSTYSIRMAYIVLVPVPSDLGEVGRLWWPLDFVSAEE